MSTTSSARRPASKRAAVPHLSVQERIAQGQSARAGVPRSSHAAIMSGDLASTPTVFVSPERRLVSDVNDLDETLSGPWECGVKRLAVSVPIAAHDYGQLCGWTLARVHARSGDRIAIGAHLGSGDSFDRALLGFSKVYAHQNEQDYKALGSAAKAGTIEVRTGM